MMKDIMKILMMMMIMSVEWRGGCGGNSLILPTVSKQVKLKYFIRYVNELLELLNANYYYYLF